MFNFNSLFPNILFHLVASIGISFLLSDSIEVLSFRVKNVDYFLETNSLHEFRILTCEFFISDVFHEFFKHFIFVLSFSGIKDGLFLVFVGVDKLTGSQFQ